MQNDSFQWKKPQKKKTKNHFEFFRLEIQILFHLQIFKSYLERLEIIKMWNITNTQITFTWQFAFFGTELWIFFKNQFQIITLMRIKKSLKPNFQSNRI